MALCALGPSQTPVQPEQTVARGQRAQQEAAAPAQDPDAAQLAASEAGAVEALLGQAEAMLRSGGRAPATAPSPQPWSTHAAEWPGGGGEDVGVALAEAVCRLASDAAQGRVHQGDDQAEAVTALPLACAALHAHCSYASLAVAASAAGRVLLRQNQILHSAAALCTRLVAAPRAGPVRSPLTLRPLCALACEAVSTQAAARVAMEGAAAACPPARLAVALDPRLAQCLGGGWRVYSELAVTCVTALLHCAHASAGAPPVLAGVGRRAPPPSASAAHAARAGSEETQEGAQSGPLPDPWRREGQLLVPRVSVALHVMARLLAGDGVSAGALGDRLSLFDDPTSSLSRPGWPERVPSGPQPSEGGERSASPPPSSAPEVLGYGGRERGGWAAAQQTQGRRTAAPTESTPWNGLFPPALSGTDDEQGQEGDAGVRNALAEACSLLVLLLAALAADSGVAITAQARAACVADDLSAACTTLAALRVLDHHNAGTDASGGTLEWQPLWEVCDAIRAEDLGTE